MLMLILTKYECNGTENTTPVHTTELIRLYTVCTRNTVPQALKTPKEHIPGCQKVHQKHKATDTTRERGNQVKGVHMPVVCTETKRVRGNKKGRRMP